MFSSALDTKTKETTCSMRDIENTENISIITISDVNQPTRENPVDIVNDINPTTSENNNILHHSSDIVNSMTEIKNKKIIPVDIVNNVPRESETNCQNVINCNNLKILYSNVDQLLNKRDELTNRILEHNPDIIQLTETLPKRRGEEINYEIEFGVPGYCKPMVNKNPSRGKAVLVKENIDVQINNELNDLNFKESLFCNIKINDTSLLLGCVYRSGSDNKCQSTNDLINLLKQTDKQKYDKIVITGDFNYPDIDWEDECKATGNEENFVNCLKDLFLNQMISEPTRHRSGQQSNLLDLCITNDYLFISNIEHLSPLGKSEHGVILITLDTPKPKQTLEETRFNFSKTDFSAFKEYASKQEW